MAKPGHELATFICQVVGIDPTLVSKISFTYDWRTGGQFLVEGVVRNGAGVIEREGDRVKHFTKRLVLKDVSDG